MRVEYHLGVKCSIRYSGDDDFGWYVEWESAERDPDLDFLRPDILPPRSV